MINLDINVGDEILGGRFKNKRIIVKTIGTDQHNQPTINGRPILKFRIEKLMNKKEINEMKKTELREIIREEIQNIINENNEKNKSIKFVDNLYKKAIKIRDTKGHRENLGYDQQPKLEDFMSKLEMPYSDKADVITYFYSKMDSV